MPTIKRIVMMTGDHFKMTLKQIADRILKMYRDGDKWIQKWKLIETELFQLSDWCSNLNEQKEIHLKRQTKGKWLNLRNLFGGTFSFGMT